MRKITIYFISMFMISGFAANAQTPSVSLTLTCPGSAVVPGSTFVLDAAYGYSNVSGNLTVVINYDNTMVSFCGSPGFSAPAVNSGSSITYTFPATAGANQSGGIQLCFTFLCPQTCFGTSLSANFTGNISSPTNLDIPGISCTAAGTVLNNWKGNYSLANYDCVNNIVTFRLRLFGSTCYKINNPNILISPSIGTLSGSSLGTVLGNTIILSGPFLSSAGWQIDIYFTIQLPCATTAPSVLTCGAVLNGDNCGSPITNIFTFGNAVFNVPANTLTAATLSQATNATSNSVEISNRETTPLTATLTTQIPLVKVNSITFNTSQSTGVTVNYTLFDCNNAPAGSGLLSLTPTTTLTVTSLISKVTYTINNLLFGQWFRAVFNFDKTNSCTPPTSDCHTFITSGNYASYIVPDACNCSVTAQQVFPTRTTQYCHIPELDCNFTSQDGGTCKKAGDVLQICIGFYNYGTAPLRNGILTFPLPSYLNYSGNLTFNSSATGISAVVTPGSLVITLPPVIAAGSGSSGTVYVCFDATVNSTALNGLFLYYFNISGDNLPIQRLNCTSSIRICQDAKVEIEKLVKGSEDVSFVSNGSGMPGTVATYQITVKNTGNTPIINIEVIDRTPESGDNAIRTCTPRGSLFSMMPNGVFIPALLSSSARYAHSVGSTNQVPSTWTGLPSCNSTNSTFTTTLNNTVKINLPGPIPPFTNYSFEMQVSVPSTATGGQVACNSVAVKCDYLDVAGNPHPLEIIESGLACLTIPIVPDPVNISCPNNQTESSCQSQSIINAAFAVWKAAFSFTGGCGTTVTDLSGFTAPSNCGGSVTITYTVTSTCGQTQSCTKTFTVTADNTPPVITATGNNDPLGCNPTATQIEAALGSAAATDNCLVGTPIVSDGPVTGTCTKSQTRTWNVSDACGNAATSVSRTATWIVDLTPPVFTTCPQDFNVTVCTINNAVTYSVAATDNCSSPVLTFTFGGATTASGSGTGSGSLFMTGVTHVTVTATDACGNINACSFNVTVILNSEINISICTVPTTTIYKGTTSGLGPLGPQSLTLTSTITGGTPGYSYSWSPSTGLNNPNIANPVASPAVTTTYVLTITDSRGCTSSLGITINVLPLSDAVCSGNGNNVNFNVCHIPPGNPSNLQNICISVNALPAHLVTGTNGHNNCYLGPCGQQLCFSTAPGGSQNSSYTRSMSPVSDSGVEEIVTEKTDEFQVQVHPNPSSGDFSIQVFSRSIEPISVRIHDNTGVLRGVSSLAAKSNTIKVGANLTSGIYVAEVIQGANHKSLKLVKLK